MYKRQTGTLLAKHKYTHSYPHCWRSKTPIIFRAVDQWFCLLYTSRTSGSLMRAAAADARRRRGPGGFRSAIVSFRRGLQALPAALAAKLAAGAVVLNADVRSIGPGSGARWRVCWGDPGGGREGEFDCVVSALPALSLARLEIGPGGSCPLSGLGAIDHPPVASVFVGFRRDQVQHPLDGFGALVPAAEKRSILGIVFTSSLFPGRAPADHVALTVLAGGALQPGIAGLPRDELVERVCSDLRFLLGAHGRPAFVRHTEWPRAIPQYNLGSVSYTHLDVYKRQGSPSRGHRASGIPAAPCSGRSRP